MFVRTGDAFVASLFYLSAVRRMTPCLLIRLSHFNPQVRRRNCALLRQRQSRDEPQGQGQGGKAKAKGETRGNKYVYNGAYTVTVTESERLSSRSLEPELQNGVNENMILLVLLKIRPTRLNYLERALKSQIA